MGSSQSRNKDASSKNEISEDAKDGNLNEGGAPGVLPPPIQLVSGSLE